MPEGDDVMQQKCKMDYSEYDDQYALPGDMDSPSGYADPYFHITEEARLPFIAFMGLRGTIAEKPGYERHTGDGVYVTTSPKCAIMWGESFQIEGRLNDKGCLAILRIKLPPDFSDEPVDYDSSGSNYIQDCASYVIRDDIPSKYIEVKTPKGWVNVDELNLLGGQ